MDYIYLGDKLTDDRLKNKQCSAIRKSDGKCRRSRFGTMMVQFENGEYHIVLARRLRKLNKNEKSN
jgi:hypothetical protein